MATVSNPSLPSPTENSPLLRARYSNGYDEPTPATSSVSPGTNSVWTRYLVDNTTVNASHSEPRPMPALMSFISLLPPSRELSYPSLERVLPPGLSASTTNNPSSATVTAANNNGNPRRTSFILCALLWLYLYPTATSIPRDEHGSPAPTGTWDLWKRMENEVKGRRTLLSLIKRVWGAFAEGDEKANPGSVEEVLWTEIPLEDGGSDTIRVIDLATAEDAPTWFLSHPLVMISLRTVWSRGIPRLPARDNIWVAFDRFSTPRITHAIFLAHHFIYLSNLAYLILAPPSIPIYYLPFRSPSYREYYLFIYSLTAIPLNRRPTLSLLPYAFVTLALGLAYPSVPTPNTGTHSLLLLSLSLFLLQLHLPNPPYIPTPLYLLEPKRVLPLATLVKGLIKQAVRPGVFFFGPVVLLVGIILAEALGDSFPLTPNALAVRFYDWLIGPMSDDVRILSDSGRVDQMTGPSHPQTRITLLLLFIASIGALFTLVNCLVMLFPGSVSSKGVLETRSEYEDYRVENEPDLAAESLSPFAANVPASSSTAFGGRGVHDTWRPVFSTIKDDRIRLAVPNAVGVSGGGPWERYGPATAISAKRSFAGVIRRYQHLRLVSSDEEMFMRPNNPCGRVALPPIFNLFAWIIGSFPVILVKSFRKRSPSPLRTDQSGVNSVDRILEENDDAASLESQGPLERQRSETTSVNAWADKWEGSVKRITWRIVVGLPGLIVGGVWFWK